MQRVVLSNDPRDYLHSHQHIIKLIALQESVPAVLVETLPTSKQYTHLKPFNKHNWTTGQPSSSRVYSSQLQLACNFSPPPLSDACPCHIKPASRSHFQILLPQSPSNNSKVFTHSQVHPSFDPSTNNGPPLPSQSHRQLKLPFPPSPLSPRPLRLRLPSWPQLLRLPPPFRRSPSSIPLTIQFSFPLPLRPRRILPPFPQQKLLLRLFTPSWLRLSLFPSPFIQLSSPHLPPVTQILRVRCPSQRGLLRWETCGCCRL